MGYLKPTQARLSDLWHTDDSDVLLFMEEA